MNISYKLAVKAKEKGFNIPTVYAWCKTPRHLVSIEGEVWKKTNGNSFGNYSVGKNWNKIENHKKIICSAPTQSELQKWLRDIHNIHIHFNTTTCNKWYPHIVKINNDVGFKGGGGTTAFLFNTYEEALEKGLKEALLLINLKQKNVRNK